MIPLFVVILWFFISCNSQCTEEVEEHATARDRRDRSKLGELTIVSYNAEWLYHENDCPHFNQLIQYIADGQPIWSVTNGEKWGIDDADNKQKIQQYINTHLENIAKYLNDMDADIYVIEEACSCKVLEKLRDKMNNHGNGDHGYHSYLAPCTAVGMQTGIITRIDPVRINHPGDKHANIKRIDGDDELKKRRIFRAEFDIGNKGKKLILYGAHLTPGKEFGTATKREQIAQKINALAKLDADNNNHYVVITGDLNTHHGDKKLKPTRLQIAGNNQEVKDNEETFRTASLGSYIIKNDGQNMKLYTGKNSVPQNAVLTHVIIQKNNHQQPKTIDCNGKTTEWLKTELDKNQNQNGYKYEYLQFSPGAIMLVAKTNDKVKEIAPMTDNKLNYLALKDDNGIKLSEGRETLPVDAKLLKIILNQGINGQEVYDCNGKTINDLKQKLAQSQAKSTLHAQFDASKVKVADKASKVKSAATRFTPDKLGNRELENKVVDEYGIALRVKLNDDDVLEPGTAVSKIIFNKDDDATKSELDCKNHDITWLQGQLANNIDVAKTSEHIVFLESEPDAAISKFESNNFEQPVVTNDDGDEKYSHWDCNIRKQKDGILDYFFVSKSIKDTLDPKLTYIHMNIGESNDERRCELWSDHTPIKLTLTIPNERDYKYASHYNHYGDIYKSSHYAHNNMYRKHGQLHHDYHGNNGYNYYHQHNGYYLVENIGTILAIILMCCFISMGTYICGIGTGCIGKYIIGRYIIDKYKKNHIDYSDNIDADNPL